VTCHDIIAYYNKKDIYDRSLFGYVSNLLWRWSVNSLGQADRVLAVSNYTKSKIVEHLKIVSSKIEVIYLGYNEFRSQRQPNNDIIERFRQIAHKRKLLSVGTTESRKNLDCLIRLLSLLNTTHNQYVLVRVGEMLNPTQIEMLIENGQQKNLIQLGNLEDEDLKFVYEHCDVFTYPSLEEGFGLPCLEAMSLGIPVIASVHASIPEIVGGSGLLVDPANIPRMALEVESMIEDSNRRIVLVQAGHERVKQFKWDTVARLVMEIYKEQLSCVE
jgi:glycosyltransferase involved in cell wall biosynthesis